MTKILKIVGEIVAFPITIAVALLLIVTLLLKLIGSALVGDLKTCIENLKARFNIVRRSIKCILSDKSFIISSESYYAEKRNKPDARLETNVVCSNKIIYTPNMGITSVHRYYDTEKDIE